MIDLDNIHNIINVHKSLEEKLKIAKENGDDTIQLDDIEAKYMNMNRDKIKRMVEVERLIKEFDESEEEC